MSGSNRQHYPLIAISDALNPLYEQIMNFYDKVTAETALEWYGELPAHLRRLIEHEKAKFKPGRECGSKECPEVYDQVRKELGARPLRPADPADPLEGHTQKQIEQYEQLKRWGNRYDELLLIRIILNNAEQIQNERRLLNKAMGINPDTTGIPNQAEGLDPTVAATVGWLQASGELPLEFLARTYRDEEAKMSDRLTAARTLMDYVHRRVPSKQEVETKDITTPKLDPKVLKGLSEKELDVLEKLLSKIGKEL